MYRLPLCLLLCVVSLRNESPLEVKIVLKHFQTVWNLLKPVVRSKLIVKSFFFSIMAILPFAFSDAIRCFISGKATKYGNATIVLFCAFVDILLLWGYQYEVTVIRDRIYPESQYSFYHQCGFDKRSFRLLSVISSMPYALLCLAYEYVFTSAMNLHPIICVAVNLTFCVLITIILWLAMKEKSRRKQASCSLWRNRFLQFCRYGALLTFAIASRSALSFVLLSLALGTLVLVLSKSLWIAFYVCIGFSTYFVLLQVERHYRDQFSFIILPQNYMQLIKDDAIVSIFYLFFVLLFLGILSSVFGFGFYNFKMIGLALLMGLLNHYTLYMVLDYWLPNRNAVREFAPIILFLIFLLLIPGASLLLLIPFFLKKHKQLICPVRWRDC